jgi:electron transfer flavoprotein alpha subunit
MGVLVYVESEEGKIKKTSREAVSFGKQLADALGTDIAALALGSVDSEELTSLGKNGASKVLHDGNGSFDKGMISPVATALEKAADASDSTIVVLPKSSLSDAAAAKLAVKLNAALGTNLVEMPDTSSGFKIKRSIFTGKAFKYDNLLSDKKVLTLKKGAADILEDGGDANVESFSAEIPDSDMDINILDREKAEGDVLLPEAEIVVSGGRGLKGPENWSMIEELAKTLGAATGCSKPVSDMEWRPHHEHVGQTGVKVSPDLYIAVGISGAIQHLAGVNSSKNIVVINKDGEAPFFKAADYGIVGDAFEVLPKLTEAIKAGK